jgi:hypothetical protein
VRLEVPVEVVDRENLHAQDAVRAVERAESEERGRPDRACDGGQGDERSSVSQTQLRSSVGPAAGAVGVDVVNEPSAACERMASTPSPAVHHSASIVQPRVASCR